MNSDVANLENTVVVNEDIKALATFNRVCKAEDFGC